MAYSRAVPSQADGIEFRRNRLPQWRLEGGVYFITWRLHDLQDRLSPEERRIVAEEILRWKDIRYRLDIFVVMDDHVHVLLQALPGHDLSKTLQGLKGASSIRINRCRGSSGTRWQKASYTELLGNDRAIASRREYIYENPRRRWGMEPHEYEWLQYFT